MDTKQTVIGIFSDKAKAKMAYEDLDKTGYNRDNLDLSKHGPDVEEKDHNVIETFFTNLMGRNTESADYYETARRGTVVTVHTETMEEAKRAAAILDKHGALNVADETKARRTAKPTATAAKATTSKTTASGETIPVIEEKMEVGKKEVTTGAVNVHSRILEKPVEKKLRLREEHVVVDRKPVDRPASKADLNNFEEGSVTLKEKAEKPMVKKEARVVEEVHIGKKAEQHTETVRDKVHRTEVEVDKVKPTTKEKTRS
jgi:uncharacterized protein (TIGR02271 family)